MRFKVSVIAIPSRNFRQRWSRISGRRDCCPLRRSSPNATWKYGMREFLLSASWAQNPANARMAKPLKILERAKGFEPSTPTLARLYSIGLNVPTSAALGCTRSRWCTSDLPTPCYMHSTTLMGSDWRMSAQYFLRGRGESASPREAAGASSWRQFEAARLTRTHRGHGIFLKFTFFAKLLKSLVPRGGIEPPTLRFSVACSTN
jgi:hypothetical protein